MVKMKAAVFHEPLRMNIEEVDVPKIEANEVLVKVKAVGICGSDMSYYFGGSPVGTPTGKGPLILGHETAGIVEDPGVIGATMGLSKGDRVCVNPVAPCFACVPCLNAQFNECCNLKVYGVGVDGAFAEYTKATATNVYKIPDSMSFEAGGLAEPLACGTYGIKRLDIQLGQDVVVFGPGPIGLMMVQLAKAAGAGRVLLAGRRDFPLEIGKKAGADFIVNTADSKSPHYGKDIVEAVKKNFGRLAQRCIVATSGMEALQNALKVTGPSSTIVYFGLPGPDDKLEVPMLEAITSDRTIKCAWLAPLAWDNVFNVIGSGQVKVDGIVTHRFSLDNIVEGIKFMKESKENKVKGIMIV